MAIQINPSQQDWFYEILPNVKYLHGYTYNNHNTLLNQWDWGIQMWLDSLLKQGYLDFIYFNLISQGSTILIPALHKLRQFTLQPHSNIYIYIHNTPSIK